MDYKKWQFLIVPNKDTIKGLSPQLQTIYMRICSFADDEWQCFPSIKTISDCSWCSKDTVIRKIAELEQLWILDRKHRFNKNEKTSNLYQIKIIDDWGSSTQLLPSSTQLLGGSSTQQHRTNSTILTEIKEEDILPIEHLPVVKKNDIPPEIKKRKEKTVFPEWLDKLCKLFIHARAYNRENALKYFEESNFSIDQMIEEVKHIRLLVDNDIKDPKYIPWFHLRIRDFVPTDPLIIRKQLESVCFTLLDKGGGAIKTLLPIYWESLLREIQTKRNNNKKILPK